MIEPDILSAQNAINTLFILCLSGIAWWLRNEFTRIHRRIDELKVSQEQSNRDQRTDRASCQARLPDVYVTRAEYRANQDSLNGVLAEIRAELRQIREHLMQK